MVVSLIHTNSLELRGLAGDYVYFALGDAELFGQELAEGAVGFAFLGSCGDFDLPGAIW